MSRGAALQRMAQLAGLGLLRHGEGLSAASASCSRHGPAATLLAQPLLRYMGTGTAGMSDKTLSKARKLAVAVGTLAGAFGSLVGVGGGVLISPIIANACKTIPQRVISGTSLAAVAATGTAAGFVYWSSGAVDLTSAALISVTAVATIPLGARATHAFDCAMLRRLMAYWLFMVAPLVPLKPYIAKTYGGKAPAPGDVSGDGGGAAAALTDAASTSTVGVGSAAGTPTDETPTDEERPQPGAVAQQGPQALWRPLRGSDAILLATGALAGFASGLLGIGGGTVVTPLLTVATGLPQLSVLGTSLSAMVAPSLIGLAQHARLGNVDWLMAAGLAVGTTIGGTLGGKLALEMPDGVLEWVFCLGMLYLGRKTLAGAGAAAAAKAKAKAEAAAAAAAAGTSTAGLGTGLVGAAGARAAAGVAAATTKV